MTSRKEIVELMQDLPMDDTWLPVFMERLKGVAPEIYTQVVASAQAQLEELAAGSQQGMKK